MKKEKHITCEIRMELLSDTIFGSGFSSPGGADIGVKQNEEGYPFLQGSTLKGLLRESLSNLFYWRGEGDCAPLLGAEDWHGEHSDRRIFLTDLQLSTPPEDPDQCYTTRNFTALTDERLAKDGSLRTAQCVIAGQVFSGILQCKTDDFDTIAEGFSGIKWLGTLRNRGFGRVKISIAPQATEQVAEKVSLAPTSCIAYSFVTKLPLMVTKSVQNLDNHKESYGYIPGSAMRGLVMNHLAQQEPEWFESNKTALLSDNTRFLPAYPKPTEETLLPTIHGFYESKSGEEFCHVLTEEERKTGLKRASLGQFCAISGDKIQGYSPKTQGCNRIRRKLGEKDAQIFSQVALSAHQVFQGYITLANPEFAPKIATAFEDHFWLGGDRQEGFGLCQLLHCEGVENPSYLVGDHLPKDENQFFLLAVSPFADWDEFGNLGGLHLENLAKKLGVAWVKITECATSVQGYGGYHRNWKAERPRVQMYDPGSLFRLETDCPPCLEGMRQLELTGIGYGRGEGYGQIVFLSSSLLSSISQKTMLSLPKNKERTRNIAQTRVNRAQWIMEQSKKLQSFSLSPSQLGSFQALCETSLLGNGSLDPVLEYLRKNRQDRGAIHGKRFEEIDKYVTDLLANPPKFLPTSTQENVAETVLVLLVDLLNYSRKKQPWKGEGK